MRVHGAEGWLVNSPAVSLVPLAPDYRLFSPLRIVRFHNDQNRSTDSAGYELPGRIVSHPFFLYPLCLDDRIQLEETINKVKVPVAPSGLGRNLKMKHHCLVWLVRTVQ